MQWGISHGIRLSPSTIDGADSRGHQPAASARIVAAADCGVREHVLPDFRVGIREEGRVKDVFISIKQFSGLRIIVGITALKIGLKASYADDP